MCPRPQGWSDEQWRAYQDRRGGRVVIMHDYMTKLMSEGKTQSEAWDATEEAIMAGVLDLQDGLEEATARWVLARQERYGY